MTRSGGSAWPPPLGTGQGSPPVSNDPPRKDHTVYIGIGTLILIIILLILIF